MRAGISHFPRRASRRGTAAASVRVDARSAPRPPHLCDKLSRQPCPIQPGGAQGAGGGGDGADEARGIGAGGSRRRVHGNARREIGAHLAAGERGAAAPAAGHARPGGPQTASRSRLPTGGAPGAGGGGGRGSAGDPRSAQTVCREHTFSARLRQNSVVCRCAAKVRFPHGFPEAVVVRFPPLSAAPASRSSRADSFPVECRNPQASVKRPAGKRSIRSRHPNKGKRKLTPLTTGHFSVRRK